MGQRPMAPVKSWAELKAHKAQEAQAPQAREGGRIWRLWPRTKEVWRYAASALGPLGQSLQIPPALVKAKEEATEASVAAALANMGPAPSTLPPQPQYGVATSAALAAGQSAGSG